MKYIYYCNSAYQVLNALNLHLHRKNNGFENIDNYKADIVVLNVFNEANTITKELKNSKIFDNVYFANKVNNVGIFHWLKTVYGIFNPVYFLKRSNIENAKSFINSYDVITAPKFSKLSGAIWQLNKKAILDLYEDGIGNYYDNVPLVGNGIIYKHLFNIFNYGRKFSNFSSLYLNKTSIYEGKYKEKLKQIPKFIENIDTIKRIFNRADDVNNKKIYWFGQYIIGENVHDIIGKILVNYNKDVNYKPHPRYPILNKSFDILKTNMVWELYLLLINDINDKLLISINSTALFTPKLLFDYEPTIIFAYKLMDSNIDDNFEKFLIKFTKLYKDKNKVLMPKNEDDLKKCIDEYMKKTNKQD